MTDFSKMELTGLPNTFFLENRNKYFDLVAKRIENFNNDSVLVIKAGSEIPKYDTDVLYYYFFQEANFYYLTGVKEAGLIATVDFLNKEVTLFYKQPDEDTKIWQPIETKSDIAKKYELKVEYMDDLNKWLLNRNPKAIYKLEGVNETSKLPVSTVEFKFDGDYKVLENLVKSELNLYYVLKECRKEKTKQEIELMKFICKVTNEAHKEMIKNVKPGLYERDLENIFNTYNTDNYFTRIWGYPCIAGSGCNSGILHYELNNKKLVDGELFLADMGMRFCNYVSDVTTTVPVNGKFSTKQKEIYDIVLLANREVMKKTKPGISMTEMNKQAKLIILDGLQKLGLIKSGFGIDELYAIGVCDKFMPHRLGHYVGIEVHDVYEIKYDKDTDVLKPGNVVTIEPGIYFRDFLLNEAFKDPIFSKYLNQVKIKTYFDFGGIRIEDDVLITEDGYVNMNADLPRTTDEIEALMKSSINN